MLYREKDAPWRGSGVPCLEMSRSPNSQGCPVPMAGALQSCLAGRRAAAAPPSGWLPIDACSRGLLIGGTDKLFLNTRVLGNKMTSI